MNIDFNFNFKGLDGKDLLDSEKKVVHAGKTLAQFISTTNTGNSIKLWDWALKVYDNKPLTLDATDAEVLSELINKSDSLTVLAKAQLLSVMKETTKAERTNKS